MVQTRKRNLSAEDCSSSRTTNGKSSKVSENYKSKRSSDEAEQKKQVRNDEGQGMSYGTPVRRSRRLSSMHSAAAPLVARLNIECLDVKDGEAALLQTPMVRSLTASSPHGKHSDTMKLSVDAHLQATDMKTPSRLSTKRVSVDAEEVDKTPAKPSARRISCTVNMDEVEETSTRHSARRTTGITIANKDEHKPGTQSREATAFVDTFNQTPTRCSSRALVSADIDKIKMTRTKCSILKRTSVTVDDDKNSDMRSQQRSGSDIGSKTQPLNDAATSGTNSSDNRDVANAVKSKQKLSVISEDNENAKTSTCTPAGANSSADIHPSVADVESFREKTELTNISFDDEKSCLLMHRENREGASKLGENAIACQEEKLQLKLDSSDTDGSENECDVEDIDHQEDGVNVQGKPDENIKKQGDSKVQTHHKCIQIGTKQDATLSKNEDDNNGKRIASSGPNNKENEPVLDDQAVSTTGGLNLPHEKPQVGSMNADLNVSHGKVSESTSNILMVFEDQKDKDHLFITGPVNIKPELSSEIVVQKEKVQDLKNVTRGLPVSGRWWKKEKKRFRMIFKDATGSKSWTKKMQKKKEREEVLAKSSALEASRQRKRNELKERQKLNKIRREENARKSEIVQVISDAKKLKKMKKKQLRYIESRDTTGTVPQSR